MDFAKRSPIVAGVGLLLAAVCGFAVGRGCAPEAAVSAAPGAAAADGYTCSMHPQIRLPDPKAKCPICFMDLIPVGTAPKTGPRQIALSPEAARLAGLRTAPVERRLVEHEIRLVGRVAYDETRTRTITARVDGRLERLYADYTGVAVAAGDHLVRLYSPELFVASQELQVAFRAAKKTGADPVLEAARRKLRLRGLLPEQIREIEEAATPADAIEIRAPIGGIVTAKQAVEGMYVTVGTPIYSIADLSRVWVRLEAYEADLAWIRYGQMVSFETRALPGEVFEGRIAFIDPALDPRTRTVGLRVNVPNPGFRLKPEMFVRAVVRARLSADGAVVEPALAGKWISPMHPEVVKDGPGACDICGMPLVRAETLGYAAADGGRPPLVIPATAPLLTGERAIVYLAVPAAAEPLYEGRTIRLGPRAGDFFLVREGELKEGDLVVREGNFKLDSALQILAGESLMSDSGGPIAAAPPAPVPAGFRAALTLLYEACLSLGADLAADRAGRGTAAAASLRRALAAISAGELAGARRENWRHFADGLEPICERLEKAGAIAAEREAFALLSEAVLALVEEFGHAGPEPLHRARCPMAFDNRGADWLQRGTEIANPYFGATMLRCGEIRRAYPPAGAP